MNINKVLLVGRVGQDPEVKCLDSGTSVANFSLATSESYIKNDERTEKTQWHKIVVWGKRSEVIEKYVFKGSEIFIEGKIEYREYEKDGNKRKVTEIVAMNIQLGARPQNESVKEETVTEKKQGDTYDEQNPPPPQEGGLPL